MHKELGDLTDDILTGYKTKINHVEIVLTC